MRWKSKIAGIDRDEMDFWVRGYDALSQKLTAYVEAVYQLSQGVEEDDEIKSAIINLRERLESKKTSAVEMAKYLGKSAEFSGEKKWFQTFTQEKETHLNNIAKSFDDEVKVTHALFEQVNAVYKNKADALRKVAEDQAESPTTIAHTALALSEQQSILSDLSTDLLKFHQDTTAQHRHLVSASLNIYPPPPIMM
ncbi:MAG: hypothetical protein SFT92_01020 [Rickettsiales bacterium]|nr:hypothetical protein [Rickettsiales bacterium]